MDEIPAFTEPCRRLLVHSIYGTSHLSQSVFLPPVLSHEISTIRSSSPTEDNKSTSENPISIMDHITKGDMAAVKQALREVNIDCPVTLSGSTALAFAAQVGNFEIVKYIIGLNPTVDAADSEGDTALSKGIISSLILACFRGYSEIAELLINNNADTNKTDKSGWSPLHNAVSKGHIHCIKLLQSKSVQINSRNVNVQTYNPNY